MKTSDIIIVQGLSKTYKSGTKAVKNVSFSVKQGEIFGMLGPNGAGKTSTLEILETIAEKDSGNVIINGYDLDTQPAKIKNSIGVQLQAGGFPPSLTLVELLQMFADIYDTKIKPLDLLKEFQLEDKKKSQPEELSGG